MIAVSEDIVEQVHRLGVKADRCTLVRNGIDSDAFQPRQTRREAKRQMELDEDRLVIGAVGRLSAEKGFDVLIRAAARLLDEGLAIELLIVGEGPARAELQREISRCKHPERMRLLGHCRDVIPIYEAMDVFVLSSLREGLPNALLEAMAMRVPVVATRIAGIPGVISNGESGLLVEAGDELPLAEAIRCLAADDALRNRLGAAARQCIVERFSFRNRMEKIRAIYDQVLNGSPSH